MGATHFSSSAKLNQGIDEMFLHLSQQMMSKADEKAKNTPGHSYSFGTSNRSGVRFLFLFVLTDVILGGIQKPRGQDFDHF